MILPTTAALSLAGRATSYLIPHVSDERGRGNPAPAQKPDAASTPSWRMKNATPHRLEVAAHASKGLADPWCTFPCWRTSACSRLEQTG